MPVSNYYNYLGTSDKLFKEKSDFYDLFIEFIDDKIQLSVSDKKYECLLLANTQDYRKYQKINKIMNLKYFQNTFSKCNKIK